MKYKLLAMDVDGTLTDGKIYMSAHGELFKAFDIRDGYAIKNMLPKLGIKSAIITGRKSVIVEQRAKELNVNYVYQDVIDKKGCLIKIAQDIGISLEEIIYIGDDVNDLEAIKTVGYGCCVANGSEEVKAIARFVTTARGGSGAIREIIDFLAKDF